MELTPAIITLIAILGACFGSFITAASWRLPRGEDMITGASKCPKCNTRLKPLDLFPIFSWLCNRGKCRYCKCEISPRYIITEIITASLFVYLAFQYGLTVEFVILAALTVALLIMIISDFETYIMPDSTTIAVLLLGLIHHYLYSSAWLDYSFGFITCLIVALTLRYGFYLITKREGLGMGDVKFLPAAGLWVGLSGLPVFFILAGLCGVLTAIIWRIIFKKKEYPFGPSLAIAMYLLVLFPELSAFATKITQLGIF